MAELHFEDVQQAIHHLSDRIDELYAAHARSVAGFEVHQTALQAMIVSHPQPEALQDAWLRLSAITLANASIHDGSDPGLALKAEETAFWIDALSNLIKRSL